MFLFGSILRWRSKGLECVLLELLIKPHVGELGSWHISVKAASSCTVKE